MILKDSMGVFIVDIERSRADPSIMIFISEDGKQSSVLKMEIPYSSFEKLEKQLKCLKNSNFGSIDAEFLKDVGSISFVVKENIIKKYCVWPFKNLKLAKRIQNSLCFLGLRCFCIFREESVVADVLYFFDFIKEELCQRVISNKKVKEIDKNILFKECKDGLMYSLISCILKEDNFLECIRSERVDGLGINKRNWKPLHKGFYSKVACQSYCSV